MVYKILDIINEGIAGIHVDERIYGLAENVTRETSSGYISMPGVVDINNEVKYLGVDDIYSFIVYHKITNATIVYNSTGYGENYGDAVNTYLSSLYVYWDRKKIMLYPPDMLLLLQARMPVAIKGLKDIKQAVVLIGNANTNTQQIYQQEYSSNEPLTRLPEGKYIMQINYNIRITFNPSCFTNCVECDAK
jgi:hypothetical protein